MAEGMTSEKVKALVKAANEAIQAVDADAKNLSMVEDLKGLSSKLAEAWKTDNGTKTIAGLNKKIDNIEKYVSTLKKSLKSIKGDEITFGKKGPVDAGHSDY